MPRDVSIVWESKSELDVQSARFSISKYSCSIKSSGDTERLELAR